MDATTGNIFVSKLKPEGTYKIKVIGTLPDLITTTSEVFTIIINALPKFSYQPISIVVPL